MKKYIILSLAVLGLVMTAPAAVHGYVNPAVCTTLTKNVSYGMSDSYSSNDIVRLQQFLLSQSYLNNISPTGYFGGATLKAVKEYQFDHDIQSTGTVGPLTRASIQNVSCGGNSYNYNNQPVFISSLSATSAAVGSSVTIYGNGFDSSYNTVNINGTVVTGYANNNGTSLTFVVPQINTYYNNQNCSYYYYGCQDQSAVYQLTVSNSRGTSNAVSFTITNGYNNNNGLPTITNVTGPTSIAAGTQGVWGFTLNNNSNSSYVTSSITWGDENTYNYNYYNNSQSSQTTYTQGQQTVSFTHTYQTAGYYTITYTVTDSYGRQNTTTSTVNVTGYSNSNYLSLSYLSPNQGRVGTSVMLQGSGFSSYDNVVHFGNGGAKNVYSSNNGSTIYFTIPSYVGPCDTVMSSGYACATYVQQVTPGTYPVYVSNNLGQTNTLYFTVTQ
jgi:hypothetical protein